MIVQTPDKSITKQPYKHITRIPIGIKLNIDNNKITTLFTQITNHHKITNLFSQTPKTYTKNPFDNLQ